MGTMVRPQATNAASPREGGTSEVHRPQHSQQAAASAHPQRPPPPPWEGPPDYVVGCSSYMESVVPVRCSSGPHKFKSLSAYLMKLPQASTPGPLRR
jgi:hypothetical protein